MLCCYIEVSLLGNTVTIIYNPGHNKLRLFDFLPIFFMFAASETKCSY